LSQNLLADRFHLRVHWDTREEPVYLLSIDKRDKSGPKFQPHADAPGHGINTRKGHGKVQMRGTDVPIEELASNLGNQLGRFVTDQTEMRGHYDFVLEWDAEQVGDTPSPSLFTALREQLGLKLQPRKGPVPILVIDSAGKPSEN
jgi:uncharacterized protein (TIGR03435 family)